MQHRATSTAHQIFAYTRLLQVRRNVNAGAPINRQQIAPKAAGRRSQKRGATSGITSSKVLTAGWRTLELA
jgi:hypothetical protein